MEYNGYDGILSMTDFSAPLSKKAPRGNDAFWAILILCF
jgi:hypothetical protein